MARPTESSALLPSSDIDVKTTFTSTSSPSPPPSPSPSPSIKSSSPRFDFSSLLRDTIIGFSDGLTVPFALTAGLSTLGSTKLVIMGGLAELFSGMISMGLGAYLAGVTERDHYASEEKRQTNDVEGRAASGQDCQDSCNDDIFAIFASYGISRTAATPLVTQLCATPAARIRFKMAFLLHMPEPDTHAAWVSGLTMGLSYFVGGLIPMLPYFFMRRVRDALLVSVAVTVATLLAFGYVKSWVAVGNHRAGVWGAVQTLVIGIVAAGASWAIVKGLDRGTGV